MVSIETRPITFSEELQSIVAGQAWTMQVTSSPDMPPFELKSEGDGTLRAPLGAIAWGMLIAGGKDVPVRIIAQNGRALVERVQ